MIHFFLITAIDIIHVCSNDSYFPSEKKDTDSTAHEENTKTEIQFQLQPLYLRHLADVAVEGQSSVTMTQGLI